MTNTNTRRSPRRTGRQTPEQRWRHFAHALAEALRESDCHEELDFLKEPFGLMTAREWLTAREMKDPNRPAYRA